MFRFLPSASDYGSWKCNAEMAGLEWCKHLWGAMTTMDRDLHKNKK